MDYYGSNGHAMDKTVTKTTR